MDTFENKVFSILKRTCANGESIINNKEFDFYTKTGIKKAGINPDTYIEVKYYKRDVEIINDISKNSKSCGKDNVLFITNVSFLNVPDSVIPKSITSSSKIWGLEKLVKIDAHLNNRDDIRHIFDSPNYKKCLPYEKFKDFILFVTRVSILEKFLGNKNIILKKINGSRDSVFPFSYRDGYVTGTLYEFYEIKCQKTIITKDGFNEINFRVVVRDQYFIREFDRGIALLKISQDQLYEYIERFLLLIDFKNFDTFPLYKYKKFLNAFGTDIWKYTSDALYMNDVYFSTYNDINDPFDLDCGSLYGTSNYTSSHGNDYVLLSTTRQNDNILMWSHYADSHKGICIEYYFDKIINAIDSDNDCAICIFGDVNYQIHRPIFSYISPDYFNTILREWIFQIECLFTKFEDWKYEKEYRFVIAPKIKNNFSSGHILKIPYRNLFLGVKFVSKFIGPYFNAKLLKFDQMKLDLKDYKLIH